MPELEAYFHYHYLDVSALKELARRWKPEILDGLTRQGIHQAVDDIRESMAGPAYYREYFIRLQNFPWSRKRRNPLTAA